MSSTILAAGERPVAIPAASILLPGLLAWPDHPGGIVVFAHGSGSGRASPRNAAVARQLRAAGFGTLLLDLLTETEAAERGHVFDIQLLTERLLTATAWVTRQPEAADLPIGFFGSSTGAAAALEAEAYSNLPIGAVVSRGGRPDLVADDLPLVHAPTLLLVGSRDPHVLEFNHQAMRRLVCTKRLVVIPGAGHLFEEPGTLEQAGEWAASWFVRYLTPERVSEVPEHGLQEAEEAHD